MPPPREKPVFEQSGSEEDLKRRYARDGFVAIRGLLEPQLLGTMVAYANVLGSTSRMLPDPALNNGAVARYGAPGFDALLVSLLDRVEGIVGEELTPTYSFARVYFQGTELARHRDRPACEHSVSIHLGSSGDRWPLSFATKTGEEIQLDLEPGDGVLYRGIERPHWREQSPADWYLQLFLHWVASTGQYAGSALDGRASLGLRSVPRDLQVS